MIGMMLCSFGILALATPAAAQMDELKQRIVTMCNDAWADAPGREQQCRTDNFKLLQDYITLINQYPQDSKEYKVLLTCSQKWPNAIPMWKMCANLEMPDVKAFRPFATGPTPVDMVRQYRAAQPSPTQPPDPNKMPDFLKKLTSPQSMGSGVSDVQIPNTTPPPPSALWAPNGQQQTTSPPRSGTGAGTGNNVYVPNQPSKRY